MDNAVIIPNLIQAAQVHGDAGFLPNTPVPTKATGINSRNFQGGDEQQS
jgi:hypothetical protein